MESKDLWVELRPGRPSYMVLRGTYGDKVYRALGMTRQGVRWRFWRIYNDMYVSAFTTILSIEQIFGTRLRDQAIRISRERYALRQELIAGGFESADTLRREAPAAEDTREGGPDVHQQPGA